MAAMIIQTAANLTGSANTIGWICLLLGAILVLAGAAVGLLLSLKEAGKNSNAQAAKAKVEDAIGKTHALKSTAKSAAESAAAEPKAVADAEAAGSSIEGVLKEVAGTIGALPERLRFSGLLVILGALLMSVATVQFGGHSIF